MNVTQFLKEVGHSDLCSDTQTLFCHDIILQVWTLQCVRAPGYTCDLISSDLAHLLCLIKVMIIKVWTFPMV